MRVRDAESVSSGARHQGISLTRTARQEKHERTEAGWKGCDSEHKTRRETMQDDASDGKRRSETAQARAKEMLKDARRS